MILILETKSTLQTLITLLFELYAIETEQIEGKFVKKWGKVVGAAIVPGYYRDSTWFDCRGPIRLSSDLCKYCRNAALYIFQSLCPFLIQTPSTKTHHIRINVNNSWGIARVQFQYRLWPDAAWINRGCGAGALNVKSAPNHRWYHTHRTW